MLVYLIIGITLILIVSLTTKEWPDWIDFMKAVIMWPLIIILFSLPKSHKDTQNDGHTEEDR